MEIIRLGVAAGGDEWQFSKMESKSVCLSGRSKVNKGNLGHS